MIEAKAIGRMQSFSVNQGPRAFYVLHLKIYAPCQHRFKCIRSDALTAAKDASTPIMPRRSNKVTHFFGKAMGVAKGEMLEADWLQHQNKRTWNDGNE